MPIGTLMRKTHCHDGALNERATDDRAERHTGDRNRPPDADRFTALLRRERRRDQRERERHEEGRAQTLQGPHA